MLKEKACLFIGHRPQKFHFGHDELHDDCILLKATLKQEIRALLKQGTTTFYTGMALGADMWCAEIVQSLQTNSSEQNIELIAVIPFEGQANRWSDNYRERYYNILSSTQEEICLQTHYVKGCTMERNRYMVEHATHLIAVYDGSPGETRRTLEYAWTRGLVAYIINPKTLTRTQKNPLREFTLLKWDRNKQGRFPDR